MLFAGVFALNLPCLVVASMLGKKRLIKYCWAQSAGFGDMAVLVANH